MLYSQVPLPKHIVKPPGLKTWETAKSYLIEKIEGKLTEHCILYCIIYLYSVKELNVL